MTPSFVAIRPLTIRRAAIGFAVALAAVAGGCAGDSTGGLFATGALGESPAATPVKASVDPVCVSMSSQIDGLRKEGTVDRLEKAADGKSKSVEVQRTALAKQTQLNKLNADFIAKCGPALPKSAVTAAAAPAQPAVPVAAPAAKLACRALR